MGIYELLQKEIPEELGYKIKELLNQLYCFFKTFKKLYICNKLYMCATNPYNLII